MDEYTFEDALASSTVTCSYPGLDAVRVKHTHRADPCTSLFFPGCSFINYGLPLVQAVYDLLAGAGEVDGISLLCCGKILEYEADGGAARAAFEQQYREHIAPSGIKRIVTACPNCVFALRRLLACDEATAGIEVVPLPALLVEMGYRVDPEVASRVARADERVGEGGEVVFCVKDSCPDRATGEFADALRAIMPHDMIVDPPNARKRSYCCGSRPRAAGHFELAQKMAVRHGTDARSVEANALVTPCVSCTYLLSTLQHDVPAYHYLELLYDYRIPWEYLDQYMKLRFLFDDALGAREFKGIEASG